VSESSAKSERESILTETDVNDEMKAVLKPEMMKRERVRERNACAREMMLIFRGQF
jgi:hypothetical protein